MAVGVRVARNLNRATSADVAPATAKEVGEGLVTSWSCLTAVTISRRTGANLAASGASTL
jgi:hypothetical protein